MDPRTLELDAERKAAGAALLALTDKVGFHAYAAAWVYNRTTENWLFVLVSPMVDTRGPRWIYERLLRAFRVCPLPEGITPLDIFVVSPAMEEAIFGSMKAVGIEDGGPHEPTQVRAVLKNVVINGVHVGDGYAAIYRRLPLGYRRRDPSGYFDKGVKQLEAA